MTRRAALIALAGATLAACAGLGQHEPIRVNLAGLEAIPGAGLEARFLAKVRVQNPNEASITYNGISAEVDLNGRSFASGLSDASGEIPRFGESVIELPLTVPATAIVRQVVRLFTGDHSKATYRVRGFLNTGTSGGNDSTRPVRSSCPNPRLPTTSATRPGPMLAPRFRGATSRPSPSWRDLPTPRRLTPT